MQLTTLLTRKTGLPVRLLTIYAVGSSVFTVSIMMLVNRAAQTIASDGLDSVDWTKAGLFCVALVLYVLCEVQLLRAFTSLVEQAIQDVRTHMVGLIGKLSPADRNRIGRAELFDGVTQAMASISQNSQFIAIAFRSSLLIVVLMGYVFYISKIAFAMLIVTLGLTAWAYTVRGRKVMELHMNVAQKEQCIFDAITDHLDGWKEVRMLRARRAGLAKMFNAAIEQTTTGRVEVQNQGFELYIFGQLALYFLLGVVVFVVPNYADLTAAQLAKTSTAVLFIIGPIGLVIQAISVLSSAEAAAGRIHDLEERLSGMVEVSQENVRMDSNRYSDFETIALKNAEYEYPAAQDVSPFHLGPVSLEIQRGEIVFISGGNGSGKSTLMWLLSGLYAPLQTALDIDGRLIGPADLPNYRSLFSSVLMDYHLFDDLYGLEGVPQCRIDDLLVLFEISQVAHVEGRRFRSTSLSTGQRKRIALIVALLEDRPVLLLDEWAADQDPQFRKKFYQELLPMWRAEGKTIIAVTHDDAYFDVADRRIHLSDGMQISEEGGRRT
jgi:putative ATP-binding cassette transporter